MGVKWLKRTYFQQTIYTQPEAQKASTKSLPNHVVKCQYLLRFKFSTPVSKELYTSLNARGISALPFPMP